jgi:glycosyltransferase involved in cell wall biosynthesis
MDAEVGAKMNICVLTKRQYMAKDLLDDRFGRFRELPLELAKLGHEVIGVCLSYRPRMEGWENDCAADSSSKVSWRSINLTRFGLPALRRYLVEVSEILKGFSPDIIWSCSDAFHAIFGALLAKRLQVKCVIDLYDNFEAFSASQIPGVLPLFRRAVRNADGVTVFSRRLADYVAAAYGLLNPVVTIENGVRMELFRPLDRDACRRHLGLPQQATVIGVAGALYRSRGIETLVEAFRSLSAQNDQVHLALAGARERGLRIPIGNKIHDLKELPHEAVPIFVNALDLAVVCYRQSAQGEFSFPQKAYEIMACRVPLIAAAVGTMNELLHDYPGCLYEPDSPTSLADAVQRQLGNRVLTDYKVPAWADSARELEEFFTKIISSNSYGSRLDCGIEAAY